MENKYHSEASASFNLEEDDGDSIVSSLTSDNESNATCASSLTSIYESNAETLPTPIEDDSILNSDDESYSESRPSIHTVPSYLRIGAVENGRVYATYGINSELSTPRTSYSFVDSEKNMLFQWMKLNKID
jgi:hypothetical protein